MYVYVLKSKKDQNLYIGCTSDVDKRLDEHQKGHVRSTKQRRPFTLIFTEEYVDKYEAYRMERFYKTATGKRKLLQKLQRSGIV